MLAILITLLYGAIEVQQDDLNGCQLPYILNQNEANFCLISLLRGASFTGLRQSQQIIISSEMTLFAIEDIISHITSQMNLNDSFNIVGYFNNNSSKFAIPTAI
jgi:hypothetical protein